MISGATIIKYLENNPFHLISHHQLMMVGAAFNGFFCLLFSLTTSTFLLGLFIYLAAICYAFVEMRTNVCAYIITPLPDMDFFLLLLAAIFSVGGLVGPLMVNLLGN